MSGGALREIVAAFGVDFDTKALAKGDSAISGMIGKLKGFAVAAAGAFAVKEVLGFTMGLAEQAVELEHHAEALGISAQSLQKWDFAASLSGVSAEELQIGLQKLQRSAVGAGGKGGELGAVFSKLHVTVKNSNGSFKNADELLTDVAGAIGDMTDPTLQTATAMQIFGRGGARLLPFLKQGRAGVAGLKAEVEALGGGFTDDFIEKSKAMVQDSKRLEFAFLGLKVKAIGPLLPLLTRMAEGATKFAVSFGQVMAKSNAAKTALIALGIGGTVALAPLLLSIAPLVAGFLMLEDVLTFLTGGKSLTGDLINKFFGAGAADKVKAFTDAISKDVGPVLHDIFAIFTDGKPLSAKFQELYNYVAKTLAPQFKTDFGQMGDSIVTLVNSAAILAESLAKIVSAMEWVGKHTINAIGGSLFRMGDDDANAAAKAEQRKASGNQNTDDVIQGWFDSLAGGPPDAGPQSSNAPLATNSDLSLASKPFWQKALGFVTGIDPTQGGAPVANVASAPVNSSFAPPEVKQTNNTPITQNFYGVDEASDAGRAAAKGATEGVKAGTHDRAVRALVPQAGSGS